MKPRPGALRQDGDFYTRTNTRGINNISIKKKGISFVGFKGEPETTIRSINSIRVLKKDGKEDKGVTMLARREAFYKKFPGSKRFRFNEQTGLVEENPDK